MTKGAWGDVGLKDEIIFGARDRGESTRSDEARKGKGEGMCGALSTP